MYLDKRLLHYQDDCHVRSLSPYSQVEEYHVTEILATHLVSVWIHQHWEPEIPEHVKVIIR